MEPFLGEIRLFPWAWAPSGWALCNGAVMQIRQYQALYAILGKRYGGDGITTFALPDLRGRVPVGMGTIAGSNPAINFNLADKAGVESVTLDVSYLPPHSHLAQVTGVDATVTQLPSNGRPAKSSMAVYHDPDNNMVALTQKTVAPSAATEPISNIQPSTVANFCIAVQGYYPVRP